MPNTTASGTVTATIGTLSPFATFNVTQVPTVTNVAPATGLVGGGSTVTISGANLADATTVLFGTKAATITSRTATQIVAISPAASAGTVDVTVTTASGVSAVSAADHFTYVLLLGVPPALPR